MTSRPKRGRMVGESYREACERLTGELKAQDIDLERLRAMEARALHMLNDDDMTAPGWSIRRYCARVILGDG